jgi:hypothetical protein
VDCDTKSAIKKLVLDLRHLLEEDVEAVLKRYGIYTDRAWLPVEKIPKATDAIRRARTRMEAAIAVEQARGIARGEAARWYIREVAFTTLNRLVGLKCLEVRGLIEEVITTRVEYGGRSLFHRDYRHAHPDEAAHPDDALPAALGAACQRVTDEMIGVLFDPDSESSVVWPRHNALRQAIQMINDLPAEIWAEDEIVGWVYQFYNAEEKVRIRKRGKPRLPAEVAVINQFFTPRWVVKFLVDNTLGRLWLEMHPDSERVRTKCDYLVPEPLAGEDSSGVKRQTSFTLDPDSPINNPAATPRRAPKPVTEIRLIDPACGTMHFGHYAFEVFQEMYLESLERGWPIWKSGKSANGQMGKWQVAGCDIPALILACNLYGVDIDLRAVQLAALSLYMKARVAERDALRRQPNTQHATRNTSYRVNLVCADARLTDGGVRARFLQEYEDDPALQKAWRELFSEMEDIAQVGSLLRVEERFRQLLGAYKPASVDLDEGRQLEMEGLPGPPRQMSLAEAPGGEAWSPRRTLGEMLTHLRRFARDALEEADVNGQMFAVEAEKTLGLLDVLLRSYDVVLMNPPFGSTLDNAKAYLKKSYRAFSNNNLLCVFVERALDDLVSNGLVGAVLDRTFLLKMSYERFRRKILLESGTVRVLTDLGWNILDDASVEVSTVVLDTRKVDVETVFLRATDGVDLSKAKAPIEELQPFSVSMSDFESYPNASFAYWTPRSVRRMFRKFPPLQPKAGHTREGLHPNDAERMLRNHWEVKPQRIGRNRKWAPVANGGGYAPYYRDNPTVILYENNAEVLRSLRGMRNEHLQFTKGITWGKRTDYISFQYLPGGYAFTSEGLCFFPNEPALMWIFLSLLNSTLIRYTTNTLCGQHKLSGYIAQLPYSRPKNNMCDQLSALSQCAHDIGFYWDTGNEICTRFAKPWLLQIAQPESQAFEHGVEQVVTLLDQGWRKCSSTLGDLLGRVLEIENAADVYLEALQAKVDEAVYDLYEITPRDRALIERELGERPPELVWPQMEGKSDREKRREHVRRLLSYFCLAALKADGDGIVPLVEGTGEPTLLDRLRERLEKEFGPEAAFQLEDDAGRVLGRPVDDWLDGQFIRWHTQLYKKRPVLWHVASPGGTFGALLYYHKLDRDTLSKVRNVYLRTLRDRLGLQLAEARQAEDHQAVDCLESALDDLLMLDERLGGIIEAGYDPVIDDGVVANILPLQEAEVLRYKKVV